MNEEEVVQLKKSTDEVVADIRTVYANTSRPLDVAYGAMRQAGVEERFAKVLLEMAAMSAKKGADYAPSEYGDPYANVRASEEWGVPGWVGAQIRKGDKTKRLKTFARRGDLQNESAEDALVDDLVYGVIALILYRETKP